MPQFEWLTELSRPAADVFAFLCRPANLVQVSPPEFHMRLVEGPEQLQLGSLVTIQGRRWGFPQRIVSEITALEPNVLLRDEQRQGPFGKWIHTHRLEPLPDGTRMIDHIEFEAPGGLLGLVLTARRIENDLQRIFAYRAAKFRELLG